MAHLAATNRPFSADWSPAAWAEKHPEVDPLESLLEEHRLISNTVDVLESWALDADQRERVPRSALQDLVSILTEFVDQIHHEKEETILMKVLFDAGVDWTGAPLEALRLEHEQERYLSDVLRHLAYQAGEWSEHARLHFVSIAREFVALQRRHIRTEYTKLYPMVYSRLSAEARQELGRRLARFDALFGRQRDHLIAMITSLTSLTHDVAVVGDIAARPVFAIPPGMLIGEATDFAEEHGIHHLPVAVAGNVVGLVCTCDLDDHEPDAPISTVMHAPAIGVDAAAPRETAARLMCSHDVGSLLVTQGQDVLGIITRGDLLRQGLDASILASCCCACCGSIEHLHRDGAATLLCADCRVYVAEDEFGTGD